MNFPPAKLKYTKQCIIDAGETLSGKTSALVVDYAWEVLDYWRSLHQTPLHYISKNLTTHARKSDKNALVVRRLKRAPSIFSKLNRENDLTLRKMQDVGGCRAIVSDLAAVLKLSQSFQDSRQHHKLERIKDYITTPKPSGYRGIHLIYKFQSADPVNQSFNGLRIEIQLRSVHQHLWATAVEIVGIITKQSLKSS
jgi:ppGpp synthetase/RelA/SpoT-type nucleotidyltranferase